MLDVGNEKALKPKAIARVFPSRTKATPDDELAFTDGPPLWPVECDEVHVSCAFSWDKRRAEFLAEIWNRAGYSVKLGGPAYDDPGGEFVPGRYLKPGRVITSRGCNNKCWFCVVPRREGRIRELPITEGFNVADSNLLQCSRSHIRRVFEMLGRQKEAAQFTGGLETRRLRQWQVDMLRNLRRKPKTIYMAYDKPDDYEPLVRAAKLLNAAGLNNSHNVWCYVLMGYPKDTLAAAEARLKRTRALNVAPFAMLYRDATGHKPKGQWGTLQREWTRPEIIFGTKN